MAHFHFSRQRIDDFLPKRRCFANPEQDSLGYRNDEPSRRMETTGRLRDRNHLIATVKMLLETRDTPEKIQAYWSERERVIAEIDRQLQIPDLHPQKIQELHARREDVLMVMREFKRQLSVRETLQRQAPAPTTVRRAPPPLPGRMTGKFPAQPPTSPASPSSPSSPSDSRTVRRLEVHRVQEVTSEVREKAQRTTQTFQVSSTTRTPAPQPSAPAAKPEAPRKSLGGIVKRVTVPQQIIDFVHTRIQNEGVCALAILLLQEIQNPEDQRLRAQAFIPLLQSRLEVLKKIPKPAQTTTRLSGAQEKATAEALLKALGISQLAPQRSEAIELSRRSAEVNQRADKALRQYEGVQDKLHTPPSEAIAEYKALSQQLQTPMRVLASLSHADFGSRGDIEDALEKIVAAEEGLKRIEQRMESLREISDREGAKRSLEQLIADLRQRITALETELEQSQHSLAEERAQRFELQATLLEMKIDRQQKDPLLASQSRDTIANAQALAARMRAQAKAMREDSKNLSATRSRDTAVIREELAVIEAMDHQASEVIAVGNDRLQRAEARVVELESALHHLRESRHALEERVAQLLEGALSSSEAQLISRQFSNDMDPLERAAFILSELQAQQQRDIDAQRQALAAAEKQLRARENALTESQAQMRSQAESLHSQTASYERSKAEQAALLQSLREAETSLAAARSQLQQLQATITEKTATSKRATDLAEQAAQRCADLTAEIDRLMTRREALITEQKGFEQQQTSVRGAFAQVEQEITRARNEADRLRAEVLQLTEQKATLSDAISISERQKITALEAVQLAQQTRASQEKSLQEIQAQRASLLAEITVLVEQKATLEGEHQALHQSRSEYRGTLEKSGHELSDLHVEIDRLRGELSRLSGEKTALETSLETLRKEEQEARQGLGSLRTQIEAQQGISRELQSAAQRVEARKNAIESEVRLLEEKKSSLLSERQQADRQRTDHQASLEKAGQDLGALRREMDQARTELSRYSQQKDQLDATLAKLRAEKAGLEKNTAAQRSEAEKIQQTLNQLQGSIAPLQEQIAAGQKELASLQSRLQATNDTVRQAMARKEAAEKASAQVEGRKDGLERTLAGFLTKAIEVISTGKAEMADAKAWTQQREQLFGAWQKAFEDLVLLQQRGAVLEIKEPVLAQTIQKLQQRIAALEQVKSQKRLAASRVELDTAQKGAEAFKNFRQRELPKVPHLQQSQQGLEGQLEALNRAVYKRFDLKIATNDLDETSRGVVQGLLERMSADLEVLRQILGERDRLRRMLVDSSKKQVEMAKESAVAQVQVGTLKEKVRALEEERAQLRAKNAQLSERLKEFESNPLFQGMQKLSQSGEFGRTGTFAAFSEADLEDPEDD